MPLAFKVASTSFSTLRAHSSKSFWTSVVAYAVMSAVFATETIIPRHLAAGLNPLVQHIFSIICCIIGGTPVPSGGLIPWGP